MAKNTGRPRTELRNQLVLNFARNDVKEHIFSVLDKPEDLSLVVLLVHRGTRSVLTLGGIWAPAARLASREGPWPVVCSLLVLGTAVVGAVTNGAVVTLLAARVDEAAHAAVGAAQAVLIVWLLGGVLASGPFTNVSQLAQTSRTLRVIDAFLPPPTELVLAIPLLVLTCWFSFFGAVATHNTVHAPVFHQRWANRLFQVALTLTYGHPVSAYVPGHNLSHHKHTQKRADLMRTSKVQLGWNVANFLVFFPRVAFDMLFGAGGTERSPGRCHDTVPHQRDLAGQLSQRDRLHHPALHGHDPYHLRPRRRLGQRDHHGRSQRSIGTPGGLLPLGFGRQRCLGPLAIIGGHIPRHTDHGIVAIVRVCVDRSADLLSGRGAAACGDALRVHLVRHVADADPE